jgi:Holliday junction resolvasome RuvABC endonuclease subunit
VVSLSKIINQIKYEKILAIDPSSHSLAWAVVDVNGVCETGKIDYKAIKDMPTRIQTINKELEEIIIANKPTHAVIEQSVYIQNFQSSRVISYIIGCAMGVIVRNNITVEDVNPLIWKKGIGYKNLTKQDREELENNNVSGNAQIKFKKERKERVREIVALRYGKDTPGLDDEDIVDALGIAMWYSVKSFGKG